MIVGIVTVFVALFVMIIFLLGFPRFFGALKRREHENMAPLPQIVEVTRKPSSHAQAAEGSNQNPQESEELIAVLTAAVAAASGERVGSFAITHVQRAHSEDAGGFNTPIWGRVERLSRK